MPTVTTEWVTTRAGRIRVRVLTAGGGEPVLFLHGPFGLTWDRFLDQLAQHRRVIAPEHPGAGQSEGAEAIRNLYDLLLHYADLLDALGLGRLAVVGHSFGGMVAAELAAFAPERVERLVLMDPLGFWDDRMPVADYNAVAPERLLGLLFADPTGPAAEAFRAVPEDPDERVRAIVGRIATLAATNQLVWPIPDKGLASRLDRVRMPTLLVWGQKDGIVPPAYAEELAARLPAASVRVIEGAAHMPHVEQPEVVAEAVRMFLRGEPVPGAQTGSTGRLDPDAQAFLDQLKASGAPPLNALAPAEARAAIAALRQNAPPPEPVPAVDDRTIPGPDGPIPIRVYTPPGPAPHPILVYFHGGGWVIGDLETVDATCRALCNRSGCLVVSVDYRLAPEHKFPAAVRDAYAATAWVAAEGGALGGDVRRLAVGGDSAGGNLAAAVALMARDRGGPTLRFQLLVYPVTDYAFDTLSYRQNGSDYFLTTDMMRWFWNHYLRTEADAQSPYCCPLKVNNLSGLPPALVITAEFDPLRDEGEAYAEKLRRYGVPVTTRRYGGMIHGFFTLTPFMRPAYEAFDLAGQALRSALAAPA
jgi:acetyl esterase